MFEVKLGEEFLMSSQFTATEEAVATLALEQLTGDGFEILIGGLGLGHTTKATLADPRVASIHVVDAPAEVIEWHHRHLVPVGAQVTGDPCSGLLHRPAGREHATSLTAGHGPFGPAPIGRFDFERPDHVVYLEPLRRRVRAVRGGETILDSDEVLLGHQTGTMPHYAFPRDDVHISAENEPYATGYVNVDWDSVDAWFEEDERVHVHPRDPYTRIDLSATSRRITVTAGGVELATSTQAIALYETGLGVRFYLHARMYAARAATCPRDPVSHDSGTTSVPVA